MTLEQILLTAVTALAGCVGGLFTWFRVQFNLILAKLNECEDDREKLWRHIAVLASAASPEIRDQTLSLFAETLHPKKS